MNPNSTRAIPEWVEIRAKIPEIWMSTCKGTEIDYLNKSHMRLFKENLREEYSDLLFDQYNSYIDFYKTEKPSESGEILERMAKSRAMWDVQKKMYWDYNEKAQLDAELSRVYNINSEENEP
jgi:hypothetical protein